MARLMRRSVRVLQRALLGCVLVSLLGVSVLKLLSLPQVHVRAAAAPPRALAASQHWPPPLALPAWPSTPSSSSSPNANACSHTLGERAFSADSRGRVCRRRDLGGDGCCTRELPGPPCARARCHRRWRCCRGHAFCTQCCMSAGDDFYTCTNRCRTSSASIISGNRYRSSAENCYGPPPPLDADDMVLALAPAGSSCDDACGALGRACSEPFLELANNCESMGGRIEQCRRRCETAERRYLPGIGEGGVCFVNARAHMLDCQAADASVQRLCACVAPHWDPNALLPSPSPSPPTPTP